MKTVDLNGILGKLVGNSTAKLDKAELALIDNNYT